MRHQGHQGAEAQVREEDQPAGVQEAAAAQTGRVGYEKTGIRHCS